MNTGNTFGKEVLAAIVQQSYTNKEVAIAIDISPQYLGDLIMNRRTPSDEVLERLIKHLSLNRNYAYYLVNRYPPEIRGKDISLPVLDKALIWITHPQDYTLRRVRK